MMASICTTKSKKKVGVNNLTVRNAQTLIHDMFNTKAAVSKEQTSLKNPVAQPQPHAVPYGTPDTWCMRMVLTPQKNKKHRRTFNLSALSKAGIREPHCTRSSAKVERTVPVNELNSTLKCVGDYHGVEKAVGLVLRPLSSETTGSLGKRGFPRVMVRQGVLFL